MALAAGWVVRCVLVLLAFTGIAKPKQVYVITGKPGSGSHFPATLYRVENGGVSRVRHLVAAKQGALLIQPYQDEGHVFILSERRVYDRSTRLLDIINLSSVTAEISYDIDLCDECSGYASGPILKNDRLIYMIDFAKRLDGKIHSYHFWGLDVATGSIMHDLDASDLEHAHLFGRPHGMYLHNIRELGTDRILSDGLQPYMMKLTGEGQRVRHDFDYKLPEQAACEECYSRQRINTDSIMLLESYIPLFGPRARRVITHVMNKKRGEWREIKFEKCHSSTAFGDWLVTGESHAPLWTKDCYDNMMRGYSRVKLHFLNTLTDEQFLYDVAMPSSQVLMIDENDVVHLRIIDELWRGKIGDGRLEGMEMIAKSAKLHHAHWMVFGHD